MAGQQPDVDLDEIYNRVTSGSGNTAPAAPEVRAPSPARNNQPVSPSPVSQDWWGGFWQSPVGRVLGPTMGDLKSIPSGLIGMGSLVGQAGQFAWNNPMQALEYATNPMKAGLALSQTPTGQQLGQGLIDGITQPARYAASKFGEGDYAGAAGEVARYPAQVFGPMAAGKVVKAAARATGATGIPAKIAEFPLKPTMTDKRNFPARPGQKNQFGQTIVREGITDPTNPQLMQAILDEVEPTITRDVALLDNMRIGPHNMPTRYSPLDTLNRADTYVTKEAGTNVKNATQFDKLRTQMDMGHSFLDANSVQPQSYNFYGPNPLRPIKPSEMLDLMRTSGKEARSWTKDTSPNRVPEYHHQGMHQAARGQLDDTLTSLGADSLIGRLKREQDLLGLMQVGERASTRSSPWLQHAITGGTIGAGVGYYSGNPLMSAISAGVPLTVAAMQSPSFMARTAIGIDRTARGLLSQGGLTFMGQTGMQGNDPGY